jgi:hypothetical protein
MLKRLLVAPLHAFDESNNKASHHSSGESYAQTLQLASKYWSEGMPAKNKVAAVLAAGQIMRVLGTTDTRGGCPQFFIVKSEDTGEISNLYNMLALEMDLHKYAA